MQIGRVSLVAVVVLMVAGAAAMAQPVGRPAAAPVRYDGSKVVRVTVENDREFLAVTSLADSVWTHSPGLGELDVQVSAEKLDALTRLGLPLRVMIDDLQRAIDDERRDIEARRLRRDISWFQNYHTLDEFNSFMTQLSTASPQLVTPVGLGNSLEGRAINGVRVTAPDQPGNPRSGRPQIFFNGCQHAREWISPMTVMYIADQLISGYATDPQIHAILDAVEVIVVPVSNPDGYVYTWGPDRMWRKNRRNNGDGTFGVDNNRNWGYQWGGQGASTATNNETYRGASAFSEPETQRLRDFVLANTRIRAHIDFHSYSQLILSPWGYTNVLPPDSATFSAINSNMASAIQAVHQRTYTAGPTYTTIYPASGVSSDWTYGAGSTPRKILGWGLELRDTGSYGFLLPADQIVPTGEEIMAGVLVLAETIAFPATFSFPDGLPATVVADQATGVRVAVTATPGNTLDTSSVTLYWRAGGVGGFTPATATSLGGGVFQATLPATACASTLEYYFTASSTIGGVAYSPSGAPANLYSAEPRQVLVKLDDACETNPGWTVGAAGDAATTGLWELAVPQLTSAQPGSDHSASGTKCWITDGRAGTSVGQYDVDGGATTLTSPVFDATPPPRHFGSEAYVSYWRWYSNDKGSNPNTNTMPVLISGDNGSTWQTLETVSDNANAWVGRTFRINDVMTPTSTMKLRFVARDATGAIIEAGVDDVRVTVNACPCRPADFNCDGFVNGNDFDEFSDAFYWGDIAADFDGNGFVNGDDFDFFTDAFVNG